MRSQEPVKIREQSLARRYGLALLLAGGAVWMTAAWSLAAARPYAAPLAAVILAAWFAGFRPALAALR
jgi:uncharacterized protein (DUF486 family)